MAIATARYITRSEDHRYTFDGVTYPGVTGILKVLDKSDALMAWAARNTAEAALAVDIPALRASVGDDGVVKALTARSSWRRDEAASLGTEVHRLADMMVRGEPLPAISETALARVDHYTRWWTACGWKLRVSEALLVNTRKGYGGTLDLLCYDRDGRTVLADIKTGKAIYHEAVLQLAAYGAAEWAEADGALYHMPQVDRYVILHVTGDGVREVDVAVGDLERAAFEACIKLAYWRETIRGKRL